MSKRIWCYFIATVITLSMLITPALAQKKVEFTVPGTAFTEGNLARKIGDFIKTGNIGWGREIYRSALFKYKYPDYEPIGIDWDMWGPKAGEKLITGLATGTAPSFYYLGHIGGPQTAIAKGLVADITDLVKGWDQYEYLKENRWSVWQECWKDGRCYGLPADFVGIYLIVYNRAYLKEAGIFNAEGKPAPPKDWTYEDFRKIAQKTTWTKKNIWGYAMRGGNTADREFKCWCNQFGAPTILPDPSGKYTWRSGLPLTVEVANFIKTLVHEDKSVLTGVEQGWCETCEQQWAGRSTLLFTNSKDLIQAGAFRKVGACTAEYPLKKDIFGMAPWPKGPTGVRINQSNSNPWGFNPTLTKEQLKAAFTFFTFMRAGLGAKALAIQAGDSIGRGPCVMDVKPFKMEWPGIKVETYETLFPEYAKVFNATMQDPIAPIAIAYGLPVQNAKSLSDNTIRFVQAIITNPNVDVEKEAKKYADIANRTVLDYKIEGQTMDNFKNYYTAQNEFYKKNFPTYYQKVYKSLWENYLKVW